MAVKLSVVAHTTFLPLSWDAVVPRCRMRRPVNRTRGQDKHAKEGGPTVHGGDP